MEVPAPRGPLFYSNPAPKAMMSQHSVPSQKQWLLMNGTIRSYSFFNGLFLGSPAFLFDSTLGSPLLERAAGPGIAHMKQKNCNTELWFCETNCRTEQCIRVTATLSLKYVNKTVSLFWQEIPLFETTKQKEQQPLRYSPHQINFFFFFKEEGSWHMVTKTI